jgi:hypothetical protein
MLSDIRVISLAWTPTWGVGVMEYWSTGELEYWSDENSLPTTKYPGHLLSENSK